MSGCNRKILSQKGGWRLSIIVMTSWQRGPSEHTENKRKWKVFISKRFEWFKRKDESLRRLQGDGNELCALLCNKLSCILHVSSDLSVSKPVWASVLSLLSHSTPLDDLQDFFLLTWRSKDLKWIRHRWPSSANFQSHFGIWLLYLLTAAPVFLQHHSLSAAYLFFSLTGSSWVRMWPCSSLDPGESLRVRSMAAPAPPFLLDIQCFSLLFHFTLGAICSSGDIKREGGKPWTCLVRWDCIISYVTFSWTWQLGMTPQPLWHVPRLTESRFYIFNWHDPSESRGVMDSLMLQYVWRSSEKPACLVLLYPFFGGCNITGLLSSSLRSWKISQTHFREETGGLIFTLHCVNCVSALWNVKVVASPITECFQSPNIYCRGWLAFPRKKPHSPKRVPASCELRGWREAKACQRICRGWTHLHWKVIFTESAGLPGARPVKGNVDDSAVK